MALKYYIRTLHPKLQKNVTFVTFWIFDPDRAGSSHALERPLKKPYTACIL